ncbi:MAG: polysaccharide biosynthesis protein [Clostridia bacterium]|nr:polysaccharide biosynthesis protein [Clostridia bacterium]
MSKKVLKKESFMQGVFAIMMSQVLIKILGLVYKLYLTNKEGFGDSGNAIYSSGFQIYALLLTLSSVGVPNAISKLVSERLAIGDAKGAHRIFKVAFVIFSFIGGIGTLILFYNAKYISNTMLQIPEAEYTLIALSPSIFFVSISSVIRGYFNGRQNLKATANSQTIEQLFKTALTIAIVAFIAKISSSNTILMAAGANLATTFSTFFSFSYLYLYYANRKNEIAADIKFTTHHKKIRIKEIGYKILSASIPISLSSLMTVITKNIDAVTVVSGLKNFMSDELAKAQYGILSGKVDTLIALPLAFNIAFATALVPSISSAMAQGNIGKAKEKIEYSLLITMLIALPCTVGMFIFAKPILNLLFPNANRGELLLQISSLTLVFTLLTQTINGALHGFGKTMVPAISLVFGVIAKLIINIILIPIPNFGVYGAAIGSVICNMIVFFIEIIVLKRHVGLNLEFNKFLVKPTIATIMMAVISFCIYNFLNGIFQEQMATIISIGIGVIIYLIFLLILKILSKEEIYMLSRNRKTEKR